MKIEDYREYKRCATLTEKCLKADPVLSFLVEKFSTSKNSKLKENDDIVSLMCGNPRKADYKSRPLKTVIGQESEQNETKTFCTSLRHELLQIYDISQSGLFHLFDTHVACTEIHAYDMFSCDEDEVKRLAPVFGKNASKKEQARARIPEQLHQNCVWQLAVKSLMKNKLLSKEKSTKAVEIVWNRCYNNMEPFGERKRLGPFDKE